MPGFSSHHLLMFATSAAAAPTVYVSYCLVHECLFLIFSAVLSLKMELKIMFARLTFQDPYTNKSSNIWVDQWHGNPSPCQAGSWKCSNFSAEIANSMTKKNAKLFEKLWTKYAKNSWTYKWKCLTMPHNKHKDQLHIYKTTYWSLISNLETSEF
jgi:hypothetical protein